MLAALRERASAIGAMLVTPSEQLHAPNRLFDAIVECAEQLIEWADADSALALVSDALGKIEGYSLRQQARLKGLRVKAFAVMHRDYDALTAVTSLLEEYAGSQLELGDEYTALRILEGQVLWHMNRVEESNAKLGRIRLELHAR